MTSKVVTIILVAILSGFSGLTLLVVSGMNNDIIENRKNINLIDKKTSGNSIVIKDIDSRFRVIVRAEMSDLKEWILKREIRRNRRNQ